jgi:hypothetical protein
MRRSFAQQFASAIAAAVLAAAFGALLATAAINYVKAFH